MLLSCACSPGISIFLISFRLELIVLNELFRLFTELLREPIELLIDVRSVVAAPSHAVPVHTLSCFTVESYEIVPS